MLSNLSNNKKVIRNQDYEKYWSLTLGFSNFFGERFIDTLDIIRKHIDKYHLGSKPVSELKRSKRRLNNSVVHEDELVDTINKLMPTRDMTGASTRKRINEYIKLGFVKPYLQGYVPAAKEYTKNKDKKTLRRLFSDTVYQHGSFTSNQTHDNSDINQIKFIIKTLLNRDPSKRRLTYSELLGLMTMDIKNHDYAKEYDIQFHSRLAKMINFGKRKYNQIGYLETVLRNLSIFRTSGSRKHFVLYTDDSNLMKHKNPNTKRDPYRFEIMKQAIYAESKRYYGRKECWLTKKPYEGLVVSHIYASAKALSNWDTDAAYDPNNALLLSRTPDVYFDKNNMTINNDGRPVYNKHRVNNWFLKESRKHDYHIDRPILEKRIPYLNINRREFIQKHPELKNRVD